MPKTSWSSRKTLILGRSDIEGLLTVAEYNNAVERALQEMRNGGQPKVRSGTSSLGGSNKSDERHGHNRNIYTCYLSSGKECVDRRGNAHRSNGGRHDRETVTGNRNSQTGEDL